MSADSFIDEDHPLMRDDPVFFNAELAEDQRDATGHFIHELFTLARELKETTSTPERCDQWLADSCELFSAVIEINLACQRIRDRADETRISRRIADLVGAR